MRRTTAPSRNCRPDRSGSRHTISCPRSTPEGRHDDPLFTFGVDSERGRDVDPAGGKAREVGEGSFRWERRRKLLSSSNREDYRGRTPSRTELIREYFEKTFR